MVEKRFNRLELRELLENRMGTIVEPSNLEELENSLGGFDRFTSALTTGRFEQKITRRDFAKMSGSMLAILTGIPAILQSCATTGLIKEEGPVHYPKLSGHKIQSPEHYGLEGCMTGIWAPRYSVEVAIGEYKQKVGKELSIYFLEYQVRTKVPLGIFDKALDDMKECAKLNVIPFITYDARIFNSAPKTITKDIYSGKYDKEIIQAAKDLKKIGDQHGGFFIRTMREMNLPGSWSWAGNPKKFKKAWIHIWNIFENEGANEYATWVWNPYVGSPHGSAERYYPGDKFVDWIGLNGYNWGHEREQISLWGIFRGAYIHHRKKHPDKPIMIAETGSVDNYQKPAWVSKGLETLKKTNIRALSWWSMHWKTKRGFLIDSRINSSPKALKAFKKGISDPYFLGKIPYKNH